MQWEPKLCIKIRISSRTQDTTDPQLREPPLLRRPSWMQYPYQWRSWHKANRLL